MPLPRPILDDRSYEQLRDELVRRIPVYQPEWTDHNPSDPGITLIELFAFLGENLLFRFNQIPETARLEFLRLLQIPLRPAQPARAMLALSVMEPAEGVLVPLASDARAGSLPFETRTEVRVFPVEARAVAKIAAPMPDAAAEPEVFGFFLRAVDAVGGLSSSEAAVSYRAETLPQSGAGPAVDFGQAVDGVLWVAVLTAAKPTPAALRTAMALHKEAPIYLNLGIVPDRESPALADLDPCPGAGAEPAGPAVDWQISTGRLDPSGAPVYLALGLGGDTTRGLRQEGVVRLRLPRREEDLGVFPLADPDLAGTGGFPPQLDDATAAKVVFWVRAFRRDGGRFGRILWVGTNAAEAEQVQRARPELLGTGTGQPDQRYRLIHRPAIAGSLTLEVEGPDGWVAWREVDGFHASGESDSVYVLDPEAGEVRFGNGVQGAAPQIGRRIRAREYRFGGGAEGNVPAGAITKLHGALPFPVKSTNPLPARGGAAAEAVAAALDRIPGELRRRDRAVTEGDFRELAAMTPGADVGRAECLPRFNPKTRDAQAAGVVTVVVWPREDAAHPNAPQPDRELQRAVCRFLDQRRLITTELWVIPPVYRKVAVAVGLQVKPGFGTEAVRQWVELAIRQYLAPLPPYGPSGDGWPLGRRVYGPELEAAALQVDGVEFLNGLEVAGWNGSAWVPGTVLLDVDQVPELAEITVVDGPPAAPGAALGPVPPDKTPVPIPIVREEC